MATRVERLTGLGWRQQMPALVVAFGHGGTHWVLATFYLLLPYLTQELGLSYTEAGLLVSAIHVSSFAANFASGMVVDVFGRRVIVQGISLVLGAAALMACGMANGLTLLMLMVAVIGATNNLWHPAAISFLSGYYPSNKGYALSLHTLGATLGDSLAPVCVGALLVGMTWQQTATWGAVPVLLIAAGIVMVLNRVERAHAAANGHVDRMSMGDYFRGLGEMFRNKAAMGLCLMAGFRSMAQNGLLMFIPLYLANELKVGPFMVGVGMLALQVGGFVAGPAAGAVSDKIGRRPVVLAGATATTLVIVFLSLAGSTYLFIAGVSMLGFVLFAMRPVIHSWMMDLTPKRMAGSATSALFGTQSGLSLIIPILGGWVADQWSIGAVFYVLAGVMLIANILVVMLPESEKRD